MSPAIEFVNAPDATFQRFEALGGNRNQRHRQGAFLVEGVRAINQALGSGWTFESFLYPAHTPLSDWASGILAASSAETHYALDAGLQARLSRKNEPSELIAVVKMAPDDLARIELGDLPLVVVIDRSNSPGNLGTIIRSCDALGADGIVLTGHSVDLYDPETIAASTGSFFALPVVRAASHQEIMPLLSRVRNEYGDVQVVGTSAQAPRAVFECSFWRPSILLLGNEKDGLSRAYQELAETMVRIPVGGAATSLNVACAASILLYEVQRQRARG